MIETQPKVETAPKPKVGLFLALAELFANAMPKGLMKLTGPRPGPGKISNLSKRYGVDPKPAPDLNSKHPGSVLGNRIRTTRARFHLGKVENPIMTNNQRVVAGRAARMGISVHEYWIRFKR